MGAHFSATTTTTVQHYTASGSSCSMWNLIGSTSDHDVGERREWVRACAHNAHATQRDQTKLERNYKVIWFNFSVCTLFLSVALAGRRYQIEIIAHRSISRWTSWRPPFSVCKLSLSAWWNVNELHARLKFASLNLEQIAWTGRVNVTSLKLHPKWANWFIRSTQIALSKWARDKWLCISSLELASCYGVTSFTCLVDQFNYNSLSFLLCN